MKKKSFKCVLAAMLVILLGGSAPNAFAQGAAVGLDTDGGQDQTALNECKADLETSKQGAADLKEKLDQCNKTVDDVCKKNPKLCPTKLAPKPAPKPAPPPRQCEMPDKETVPAKNGVCDCADTAHGGGDEYVGVVRDEPTKRVCVPRAKAFADLVMRVKTLEGNYPDLTKQLDELKKKFGKSFEDVQSKIATDIGKIAALEADVAALKAQVEAISTQLRKLKAQRVALRLQALADLPVKGGAGAAFGPMARAELAVGLNADSTLSALIGGGIGVTAAYQSNVFGARYVPMIDLGLRYSPWETRVIGFDFGAAYRTGIMVSHGAGSLGPRAPSAVVDFAIGPYVGGIWNVSNHFHLLLRGGAGFGTVNYRDSNRLAADHPAMPWFQLGLGGTFGIL